MPIENRDLATGTRLEAKYKGQHYEAVVEEGPTYRIDVAPQRELQGKVYKSPSSAAMAIIGGAANGWRFWGLAGTAARADVAADSAEKPAKAERKPKAATAETPAPTEQKPKAQRSPRKFKLIKRMEEQPADLEEGQVAYWCSACQKSFIAGAETPEVCPEGHRADDPELTSAPAPEAVAAAEAVNA
jgi:hypothetical protein